MKSVIFTALLRSVVLLQDDVSGVDKGGGGGRVQAVPLTQYSTKRAALPQRVLKLWSDRSV